MMEALLLVSLIQVEGAEQGPSKALPVVLVSPEALV